MVRQGQESGGGCGRNDAAGARHVAPKPGLAPIGLETNYQGQALMDPPSVEGWHTGQEWIDSGSLLRRINFVANRVGDTSLPGIKSIIQRLAAQDSLTATEFVDICIDLMGPARVDADTRSELIVHVEADGPVLRGASEEERAAFGKRVGEVLPANRFHARVPVRLITYIPWRQRYANRHGSGQSL